MLNIFAHAGYHRMETMDAIDHCAPIIIGAGLVIAVLLGIIFYMLRAWQPKKQTKSTTAKKRK